MCVCAYVLQKVQELAEAEKRCLRQSIASLQDRLSASDASQASQDQVEPMLLQQQRIYMYVCHSHSHSQMIKSGVNINGSHTWFCRNAAGMCKHLACTLLWSILSYISPKPCCLTSKLYIQLMLYNRVAVQ